MRFPKRTPQHITETASWKILVAKTPENWLLRDVNERDYGIDGYIELVSTNGDVEGHLCSVQLKGTKKVEWKKKGRKEAMLAVEISTVNYWMGLPIPVFLILADNTAKQAFFAPVQFQVRKGYARYLKEKPFTFTLRPENELGTDVGDLLFIRHYLRERNFPRFHSTLRMLLIHYQQYLDFIEENQGLNHFLGVEPEEQTTLLHVWQSCLILGNHLCLDMKLPDIAKAFRKDAETWKDQYYRLHNQTLDTLLKALHPVFLEILEKCRKQVVETDKSYWQSADYPLFAFCQSIRPESWRST